MCCGQQRREIKSGGTPGEGAVKLLYRGNTPIQIRGTFTGFVYDFPRPNTVQTVDQRDAAIILQTRLFRQVQ